MCIRQGPLWPSTEIDKYIVKNNFQDYEKGPGDATREFLGSRAFAELDGWNRLLLCCIHSIIQKGVETACYMGSEDGKSSCG